MNRFDTDTLQFFARHPQALLLYDAFLNSVYALDASVHIRVQKTQITFSNRHVFTCVSFARVRKKPLLPEPYLVVTLGLPFALDSARVAVKTEPYPGRWTHHIVLSCPQDVDAELAEWLRLAYDFSMQK